MSKYIDILTFQLLGLREGHTKEVGHDVIADHQTDRNNQPEDALEGVLNAEVGGAPKQEQSNVCPGELRHRYTATAMGLELEGLGYHGELGMVQVLL